MDSHDTLIAPAHPQVLGRYRLLERLGAGGFGIVWRAHDQLLDREVAVKAIPLPDGEERERATREALATARLAHPAIVALYEACAEEDTFYLISELVHGDTLARLIAADALADEEIAEVGVALADALLHAHQRGVIHRDIKPHNVLVPATDAPLAAAAKLTDFGGALLAGEEALTRTGDVLGTLAYMAPEQLDGDRVSEAADLYSLALVLYEAFSGVNPVRGPTPAATVRRIGESLPPLARHRRDLPRELSHAVDRALYPDPEARGTLRELYEALAHASLQRTRGAPCPAGEATERFAEQPAEERPDAGGWLTIERLAWLAAALGVGVWQLLDRRPAVALLALWAVLPLVVPVRRPGVRWGAAALAPALGLAGLAGAFPALAGQLSRWRTRALLGALGYWWACLARLPLHASAASTLHASLRLASVALLAGLALWALAAMVLPWVVRGRAALLDALASIAWASTLLAGTLLLRRDLPQPHAELPASHAAILSVALAAAVAIVARALRGPVAPVVA
ncbi:MAG TPA: serine/threonine-protein kinase [Solirubrobacteraceae bacterium]|nr:serine/threonine-protein kinase [Solirubrobacteraceae bacterium]